MYKIPKNDNLPNEYFLEVEQKVRDVIGEFVNTGASLTHSFRDRAQTTVTIQVINGSYTDVFLKELLQADNLKLLLTGDMGYLLDIVCKVMAHDADDVFFKSLTLDIYRSVYRSAPIIDSFRDILQEIFVNRLFEKGGVIDKTKFTGDLGLEVCPYCSILPLEFEPDRNVKPQLDHFLPKGIYPFLAMSYYNLIPACHDCNLILKGEKDPLDRSTMSFRLLYPYEFEDRDIHFSYVPNVKLFANNNCRINTWYSNDELKGGYEDILDMTKRYSKQGKHIKKMHAQMISAVGFNMLKPLRGFKYIYNHFKATALGPDYLMPWQDTHYKLKHDCFEQMINEI